MLPKDSERCCFIEEVCNPSIEEPLGALLLYCEKPTIDSSKQAKARNNAEHARNYRSKQKRKAEYQDKNKLRRLRNYYSLTEKKLKDSAPREQALRDLWPTAKNDQHDLALSTLKEIKGRFLNDAVPLPEIINKARSDLKALTNQLNGQRANDYIADYLWAHCQELDCSIGTRISSLRDFGPLKNSIVEAHKAWSEWGNLINLNMALCIHADFCRARYFLEPDHKHLDDAAWWLDAAIDVLKQCQNKDDLVVLLMRHNCTTGKFKIKLDQGAKVEVLKGEINDLKSLAADIALPKADFITACYETEWALYAGETDQAKDSLTRALDLYPQIGINTFSLREYILWLKTALAHRQEKLDERDAYYREYAPLLKQEPTPHGWHNLGELRKFCGHLPEVCPYQKPRKFYVDLLFIFLQEHLIPEFDSA